MVVDISMSSQIPHGWDIARLDEQPTFAHGSEHIRPQAPLETLNSITTGGSEMFGGLNEPYQINSPECDMPENGTDATLRMQQTSLTLFPSDLEVQERLLKEKYGIPKLMDDTYVIE